MSICIMGATTFYCLISGCSLGSGLMVKAWLSNCLIPSLTATEEGLSDKMLENVIRYNEEHRGAETVCQEYQTVFNDKDLLIKTLQEHGVTDFETVGDNVNCRIEEFKLKFYRESDMPYKFEITHSQGVESEEIIDNLGAEYAQNAQEATYLKIKERLTKSNLQIDDEEVLEDDSIMLTINLD